MIGVYMTLPDERTRSVLRTRNFLLRLLSPSSPDGCKRIPRPVREEARRLLRHYPGVIDLSIAGERAPTVFDPEEAWRLDE
jgi:hypothetical protein